MNKDRKKKHKKEFRKEQKKEFQKSEPQGQEGPGREPRSKSEKRPSKLAPPGLPANKWFAPAALVLLTLAGLVCYWPSFKVPFLFDDQNSIVDNSFIRMVRLTPHALSRAAFQDFQQNRPLSNLSFGLNYYINGLNPRGFHFVNFFFHILSAICILLILERVFTRRSGSPGHGRMIGLLASLLWLVHPINTQAVTYIVQRHTSMAGAFSLLCLFLYDLGRSKGNKIYYALSALSGLCGMACKETALVMPAIIFIYDLFFFQELKPGWLKKDRVWVLLVLAFYLLLAAVLLMVRKSGKFGSGYGDFPFTPWERTLSQGRVLLWYLGLIIFPAGPRLSVDHDFAVSQSLLHPWTTLPAWLFVFGMIAFALLKARRYPLLSFSVIWYFGQLAIESLPLPIDLTFEHRLYLAAIPVLAAIPMGLIVPSKKSAAGTVLVLLIILFYGALTYERNRVWQSPVSLWRDAGMKAPGLNRPWNNLCSFLLDARKPEQAALACKNALKADPNDSQSHLNYGICAYAARDLAEAEREFQKAIELKPEAPLGYFNLGLVKFDQNDAEAGRTYFQKASEIGSADADMYFNMGMILEKHGFYEDALPKFFKALKRRPEWVEARLVAARSLADRGRCPEAVALIQAAPFPHSSFNPLLNRCRGQ
jgi:protein O-mannosyl-transferase